VHRGSWLLFRLRFREKIGHRKGRVQGSRGDGREVSGVSEFAGLQCHGGLKSVKAHIIDGREHRKGKIRGWRWQIRVSSKRRS